MKPKHSPIFNAYAEIAQEQGLVSLAEHPDQEEKKSLEWDAYNLPTENLLEKAHPETKVLFDAYDPFNGVVETLQERQNIMTYIALKTPTLLQTNHRYIKAQQDLFHETVRLGFLLDALKDEKIAKLADACTEQLASFALDEDLTNDAIAGGLAIGAGALAIGVAGISAIYVVPIALAGWILYANSNPISLGLAQDLKRAIDKLSEATSGDWYESGYSQLAPMLAPLHETMQKLYDKVSYFSNLTDEMETEILKIKLAPTSDEKNKELLQFAQMFINSGKDKELKKAGEEIKELSKALSETIPDVISILKQAPDKYETSGISNWAPFRAVKELYYGAMGRDTDDEVDYLKLVAKEVEPYYAFMDSFLSNLDVIKSRVKFAPQNTHTEILEKKNPQMDSKPSPSTPNIHSEDSYVP